MRGTPHRPRRMPEVEGESGSPFLVSDPHLGYQLLTNAILHLTNLITFPGKLSPNPLW